MLKTQTNTTVLFPLIIKAGITPPLFMAVQSLSLLAALIPLLPNITSDNYGDLVPVNIMSQIKGEADHHFIDLTRTEYRRVKRVRTKILSRCIFSHCISTVSCCSHLWGSNKENLFSLPGLLRESHWYLDGCVSALCICCIARICWG